MHLFCHTCLLSYFTLVCLWCRLMGGRVAGKHTVTWLPEFLGCSAIKTKETKTGMCWRLHVMFAWSRKKFPCVFIPGERRKSGALLCGICLNGHLDFLLFSFSFCSCEIRLLQCLCFGFMGCDFGAHLRAMFLNKQKSKQNGRFFHSLILQKNTRCLEVIVFV